MTSEQPDEKAVAYHESGHAVAAFIHGLEIECASVRPDEAYRGRVRAKPQGRPIDPRHLALTHLAGPAAQRHFAGECSYEEAREDYDLARDYVSSLLQSAAQQDAYLSFLEVVAAEFVKVEALKIHEFSIVLKVRGSLSGEEAEKELAGFGRAKWTSLDWP